MKYTVSYLSDGEMLEDKTIYMVDQERKNCPRGNYFFSNVLINSHQVDENYIEMDKGFTIAPGTRRGVTPQMRVKKVYYEKTFKEYFEPKEEFEPTFGNRLPYESMFRTMMKMYGIKTNEELDMSRQEIDFDTADDEDKYVLSQFGLLNEEPLETPLPDETVSEAVQSELPSETEPPPNEPSEVV